MLHYLLSKDFVSLFESRKLQLMAIVVFTPIVALGEETAASR